MWIPVLTTWVHPSTLTFYSYGNGTMVLVAVRGGSVRPASRAREG